MLQETLLGILEIHKGKSLPDISIGKVRGDQQKQPFADVCYKIGVLSNFKKFTGKRQRIRCPVNFAKFLRTPLILNISGLLFFFFYNYYYTT